MSYSPIVSVQAGVTSWFVAQLALKLELVQPAGLLDLDSAHTVTFTDGSHAKTGHCPRPQLNIFMTSSEWSKGASTSAVQIAAGCWPEYDVGGALHDIEG
jgi:hypothetical protein